MCVGAAAAGEAVGGCPAPSSAVSPWARRRYHITATLTITAVRTAARTGEATRAIGGAGPVFSGVVVVARGAPDPERCRGRVLPRPTIGSTHLSTSPPAWPCRRAGPPRAAVSHPAPA